MSKSIGRGARVVRTPTTRRAPLRKRADVPVETLKTTNEKRKPFWHSAPHITNNHTRFAFATNTQRAG